MNIIKETKIVEATFVREADREAYVEIMKVQGWVVEGQYKLQTGWFYIKMSRQVGSSPIKSFIVTYKTPSDGSKSRAKVEAETYSLAFDRATEVIKEINSNYEAKLHLELVEVMDMSGLEDWTV